MNKQQAQQIIRDTFENSFDKNRFAGFIKNLLNGIEDEPFTYQGNYIPDAYKQYIKTLERIGKFSDGENNIDILVITLQKETSLERARTMQRNFIAWYLNGSRGGEMKDAALAAFVSPDEEDWRFSLVKMDYKFEKSATGRMKVKEEFTPARRWSFLVGANEKSHTAQSRLVNILANDEQAPTLDEIEKSFDIETVTKEFFLKYRELFLDAKKELDEIVEKDEKIKTDFIRNDVSTVDFCKKLLGQIVFLYFLQKKGWFGVKRSKEWGTGSKHFLRELFQKKHGTYKNFFNDILEPLFYNTLAVERPKDYSDRFDCKTPFLNGGLFDPINNYDWIETDIYMPDELFSNNIKTKDGDIGTGILDVFDRYNFTVKEDEPLEKEVAIDPEMLGKVFENLLEVKDRKSKGTYYTPREIVHYMCQESLINYLVSELSECHSRDLLGGNPAPLKEDIETLIKFGETAVEHDSRIMSEGRETRAYSFKLPESIRRNAGLIDEKLANIHVCDPAIGSGAFPLGMMHEIVNSRQTLTTYIPTLEKGGKGGFSDEERTPYNFKRHAIHNCLYGVDIDPGAVEIAKLRLWLSLMVDEEDIKHIKPLPNLDYKIMQGNSLLEEFEGIKLFDEKLISAKPFDETQIKEIKEKRSELQKEFIDLHNRGKLTKAKRTHIEAEQSKLSAILKKMTAPKKDSGQERMVYEVRAGEIAEKLKKLHEEFFEAYHINKKVQLKEQIDSLEWDLIETTLKEYKNENAFIKLEQFKRSNTKPFFLWKLNFSEVFQEKGGFDVVIGNPPYFNLNKAEKSFVNALSQNYKDIHTGYNDIVYYFIYHGCEVLNRNGCCTLITSNYFLGNEYARNLRKYLKNHISKIVNFKDHMVFNEASIHTCISFSYKEVKSTEVIFFEAVTDDKITTSNIEVQLRSFTINRSDLNDDWLIADQSENPIFEKLKTGSVLLGDIALIAKGPETGKNDIFTMTAETATKHKIENNILRKCIKNSNINKYFVDYRGLYLLYVDNSFDQSAYKHTFKYLSVYKKQLLNRRGPLHQEYAWYRLHRPSIKEVFDASEKLVVPYRAARNCFAYDNAQYFNDGGDIRAFVINDGKVNIKYVLALLNSRLIDWFYGFIGKPKGKVREYFNKPLSLIPIKKISLNDQKPFITLVDQILTTKQKKPQADTSNLDNKIDIMVYKLYDLTPKEIEIVKGKK